MSLASAMASGKEADMDSSLRWNDGREMSAEDRAIALACRTIMRVIRR